MQHNLPPQRKRRQYLAAVVLGTALAAVGQSQATAEVSSRAVGNISRYCTACWRNARLPEDRWSDCTQEVFRRLLERVPTAGWDRTLTPESSERRELVRAIDAVKKRTQRDRHRTAADWNDLPQQAPDASLAEERELVRQAADRLLSDRQQRILDLVAQGWSIPDMAQELSIPVQRVSDEKYKAIRKLQQHFNS